MKAACDSVRGRWLDSYILIHSHPSHTLSQWMFHNCYRNCKAVAQLPASLSSPPLAYPVGQRAAVSTHRPICQVLEATLMWKEVITVLCCDKRCCCLNWYCASIEALIAIPWATLFTSKLERGFTSATSEAASSWKRHKETIQNWL